MQIVKVQRAIKSTSPIDPHSCLVYGKNKLNMRDQRVPKHVIEEMNKRSGLFAMKAFFEAEWNKRTETWVIGKIVEDQTW